MRRAVILLLLFCVPFAAQQTTRHKPEIAAGYFRGRPVTFEIIDGLAMVEGDIVLGRAADIQAATPALPKTPPDRRDAIARAGDQYLWPSGVIPYIIDPAMPNVQRILDAVQHWNEKTPLRLVARTDQANYLHFLRQNGGGVCYSSVGMIGGRQNIGVDDACGAGTLIHEIGHTAGLFHEQSRLDRDAYVQVLFENIESGREGQFSQPFSSGTDIGRYDYASIMHYSGGAFSKNTKPTIVTVPLGIPLGQRSTLSVADLDALMRLYGAPPALTTVATNPDGLAMVVDGVAYTAPQSFGWTPGSNHTLSVPVFAPGSFNSRWVFARWSDDGGQTHAITADTAETSYTANFMRQFPFTTKAVPGGAGSVQVDPPSADDYYALGTELRVTAAPAAGYSFSHWTLPGGRELHGRSANPAVLAAAAYEYTANFTTEPLSTVTTQPEGLTITVDGVSMLSPASFAWPVSSTHVLSVDAAAAPRGVTETRCSFQAWSDGGAQSHAITAAGTPATYAAAFRTQHLITVTVMGPQGGQAAISPETPEGFHDEGSTVELMAAPPSGYKFARWSGDFTGRANPASLTVSRPLSISATFGIPGAITSGNVMSSATVTRSPIVPGGLFTILGVEIGPEEEATLSIGRDGLVSRELAGVRVVINGAAAPLVYVSRDQINAVAPFAVAGRTTSVLEVQLPGKTLLPAFLPVAEASPAVFTMDASGKGQGAILNQDGSVNSPANPAARGSVVVIYATGAGQTDPPGIDGKLASPPLPKPLLLITVRIGGRLAKVEYAGDAPELVSGVLQVNARVPDDVVPGSAVPVVLKAGQQTSSAVVTLAVK